MLKGYTEYIHSVGVYQKYLTWLGEIIIASPRQLSILPTLLQADGCFPLSHITIIKTMDSGERGINPVAMTTINPQKVY